MNIPILSNEEVEGLATIYLAQSKEFQQAISFEAWLRVKAIPKDEKTTLVEPFQYMRG